MTLIPLVLACHRQSEPRERSTHIAPSADSMDSAVDSSARTGETGLGVTDTTDTAAVDVEVPFPVRCGNPAGVDAFTIGDAANEVDQDEMVGTLLLDISEPDPGDATWLTPTIKTHFSLSDTFLDSSQIVDPYEGLDDCIIFAPYDYDGSAVTVSAGTVTYELAGQQELVTPWWGFYEYRYGLWYPTLLLHDLDAPLEADDLWGRAVTITAEGADLPAFSIPNAVTVPAGPLAITSPLEQADVDKDDLRFQWAASPPGSTPVYIALSFAGNNDPGEANAIWCFVEDDGDWTPPAEVWDWVSEPFPVGLGVSMQRGDRCAYEIAPRQFVQISAAVDSGYSLTITDD